VKRLSAALAGVAALAVSTLGLSGCNVRFSPYAAVVNGSEVSQQQMQDAQSAVASNAGYRCTIQAGGTLRVAGAGDGTFNAAFSAEVLSILIQDKVVRQDLVRLGLPEPAGLDPVALEQLQAASAPATGCTGTGASVVAAFPAAYRQQLIRFQVDEDVLAAHLAGATLTPGGLAGFEASHQAATTLACISVIVVKTKATAASLRRQLLGGASFAALAKAHSLDTSTAAQGGAIGCLPDAEFSAPLNKDVAALTIGRVSSPISFSSAWLLLLLTQRRPETYAQLVSSLLTEEQGPLGNLITRLVRAATVEIDPQYGSWKTATSPPRVEPNPGPPARYVPNPSASVGPKTSK
jgi:parvulin-like peptidyl-prolyl isomerase